MRRALHTHWPEYLIEAAGLGLFMVSACAFATLLFHPGSAVAQQIESLLVRRMLMGLAMGGTAIALVYSPWGRRSGAHFNPALTLTFHRLGKVAPRHPSRGAAIEQAGRQERVAVAAVDSAIQLILEARRGTPPERAMLVAVSGIDASGKGFLTSRIAGDLETRGLQAVHLNVGGWLNLPVKRFNSDNPARHFYEHAIRFDEMFERLVLPLQARRSHRIVADFTEETATAYRPHTYAFEAVDVVLLEGIFLLKTAFRCYYDLSLWVECTFETALERAIDRGQEGLPEAETIRAYETIYFPAQQIHLQEDDPRSAASAIIVNDWRLAPTRL